MPLHSRNKGKAGELEAYKLLNLWARPVCDVLGIEPLFIERNQNQSRAGGYDLVGAPWLAIEVKRHETLALPAWWRQTLKQAGEGQTPVLMWRQNRGKWSFRIRTVIECHGVGVQADCDLGVDDFRRWFEWSVYQNLKT